MGKKKKETTRRDEVHSAGEWFQGPVRVTEMGYIEQGSCAIVRIPAKIEPRAVTLAQDDQGGNSLWVQILFWSMFASLIKMMVGSDDLASVEGRIKADVRISRVRRMNCGK